MVVVGTAALSALFVVSITFLPGLPTEDPEVREEVGDMAPEEPLDPPPALDFLASCEPLPIRLTAEFHEEMKSAESEVEPAFQFSSSRRFNSRSRIKNGLKIVKSQHYSCSFYLIMQLQ